MILTITLNPAVDISYNLNKFNVNGVNRCNNVIKTAGGKGLNVTRVISQVNEEVCATGLIGGANGQFIVDKLNKDGIRNDFVEIKGETRNCIAILHEGRQTEILEKGPEILQHEKEAFLEKYKDLLKRADVIVASGSVPKDLGDDFYSLLIKTANEQNKKFILDTSGSSLKNSIDSRPYLIKPNKDEISQLIGREVNDQTTVVNALKDMVKYNIAYIIISLGKEGAVALHNNKIYKVNVPKVHAVNPVGSGDATVAGFSIAIKNNFDTEKLLKYGCVLGTLNSLEKQTGYVNLNLIDDFMEKTYVEVIDEIK